MPSVSSPGDQRSVSKDYIKSTCCPVWRSIALPWLLLSVMAYMSAYFSGCSDAAGGADVYTLCTKDEDCEGSRCVDGFCELPDGQDDTPSYDDAAGDIDTTGGDAFPEDGTSGSSSEADYCVEGRTANACGGCTDLGVEIGAECGTCGGGRWECHRVDPDRAVCSGATAPNTCGGCEMLPHEPGWGCGSCGEGIWTCVDGGVLACVGERVNVCGGCRELPGALGDACGRCGRLECDADDDDLMVCVERPNACGGCGALDNEPGDACGACGDGVHVCTGDNSTSCSGGAFNACGSCASLAGLPDAPCGECGHGRWVCDAEGVSVSCQGDIYNACGGCDYLGGHVGGSCGACGRGEWACSSDGESLSCVGDAFNGCGGCALMSSAPGDSCGDCYGPSCVYECDGEDALVCVQDLPEGFVWIGQGTFMMGSPEDELGRPGLSEDQRETTITRGFYMQQMPVTQGQWYALMGNNPSCFQSYTGTGCSTRNANPNGPLESINWWDAVSYANAFSRAAGLPECYSLSCTGAPGLDLECTDIVVSAPDNNPYECAGYRLPTEAEWEYAARAGTTKATYAGDLTSIDCDDATLPPIAWFCGNSGDRTHTVGQKLPNNWGLYDMLGNVSNWVWDFGESPYGAESIDPTGPEGGTYRILRGGGWGASTSARAAARPFARPEVRGYGTWGLRLVRTAP